MEEQLNSAPLPLKDVSINDTFWSRYMDLVRKVVIPYQWEALNDRVEGAEPSHAVKNFRIAAGLDEGEFQGMVFQDSDLAKWLEAASYTLETHHDPELERTVDGLIDAIEKAQMKDGYLNTYFTLKEPGKRWTNLRECHELYCAGHMIEAAVAYYKATGKRKLLDVMCRFADHIDSVFGYGPGKKKGYPGHEEIELALVKLYKVTGREKYLKLSKYFIDERGREPYYFDIEAKLRGNTEYFNGFSRLGRQYAQAHLPVRQQTAAEGHSVRAMYLYTAMADIARETGDRELLEACRAIWDNIVSRRMYITGGIGSTAHGETFTFDYDLPNDTAYAETCASIGLVLFAFRMLQIEAKSSYADVMERALYNTVISGMSLDGKRFFYVNPLEVQPEACEKDPGKFHVKPERQKWFGCACCPPNIARLLSSLGQYIYTANDKTIYTHLYMGGESEIEMGNSKVRIVQQTEYPWKEEVALRISLETESKFELGLRIPDWCRDAQISINGSRININDAIINGYAMINRLWRDGDLVRLMLPMKVLEMKANPLVREDMDRVAVQRGPFVYCLEEKDNGKHLHQISLPRNVQFEVQFDKELLGGTTVIAANGERAFDGDWKDTLYKADTEIKKYPVKVKFIPYYVWANRGVGEMEVWVRKQQ